MNNISYVHITDLYKKINPHNPKIHNLDAITESIQRYGFWGAIILNEDGIDNKVIGAGNGRTKALMSLYQAGVEIKNITDWQIPVMVSNLPEHELFNFVVDDNLVGMISGGLSQMNNAVLIDKIDSANLPITVSQADYDFLKKVFENDFKKDESTAKEPEKEVKPKLKKIVITLMDELLHEEILHEVHIALESYALAEQIRIK